MSLGVLDIIATTRSLQLGVFGECETVIILSRHDDLLTGHCLTKFKVEIPKLETEIREFETMPSSNPAAADAAIGKTVVLKDGKTSELKDGKEDCTKDMQIPTQQKAPKAVPGCLDSVGIYVRSWCGERASGMYEGFLQDIHDVNTTEGPWTKFERILEEENFKKKKESKEKGPEGEANEPLERDPEGKKAKEAAKAKDK